MSKIRVLIVDDHPFFRKGLVEWLKQQESVTCCGEADSVAEARVAIPEAQPEIVLMDLRLEDGEGLELIRELAPEYPQIRIVALSQFDEDVYAHRALLAGARGYVMKSEATNSVLKAIQTVMKGKIHLSPRMAERLVENLFPGAPSGPGGLVDLSDRELQVFQLLGIGQGTIEIGRRLNISPKTVETYRQRIKEKLGLADGTALLRAAALWAESGRFDP